MATESEPEAIRQQMDDTRTALNDKIATLEQQVVETVQGASAGVMETVEVLKDAVQDTVQTVRDSVGDTVEGVRDTFSIDKQVERRPWTVLAISAGIGFAAGYLMTPPRRRSQLKLANGLVGFRPARAAGIRRGSPDTIRPSAAQPATSSNGRGSEESHAEPAAAAAPVHGIFDNLTHAFDGEISALKGMAVGALGGLVRDFVVPQIPPAFKEKVQEVIDGVTTKLGGEPVHGSLFGDEAATAKTGGPASETSGRHESVRRSHGKPRLTRPLGQRQFLEGMQAQCKRQLISAQHWQQAIVVLSGTAVVTAVVAALYWAQIIFVPITLAIFLAFLLTPPVRFLERRGLHRAVAVVLVVGTVFLFVGEVGYLITRQLSSLAAEFPKYTENVEKRVEWFKHLFDFLEPIQKMFGAGQAPPPDVGLVLSGGRAKGGPPGHRPVRRVRMGRHGAALRRLGARGSRRTRVLDRAADLHSVS